MNKPRVSEEAYIQFLVASPAAVSGTEAARVHAGPLVAHDAYTRLLHRLEPDAATLWHEARGLVVPGDGVLVLDDTTLDKPYARRMGLVTRHWSGKHHAVVQGINLLALLWSDGQRLVPVDYRLYEKAADGQTKHDHFRQLVAAAHARGFAPRCVLFDGWYAALDNLKQVRLLGWPWLTRLKSNRQVRRGEGPLQALSALADVPAAGSRSGSRATARCACSGWPPQTAARTGPSTGPAATWAWAKRAVRRWRRWPGASSNTTGA